MDTIPPKKIVDKRVLFGCALFCGVLLLVYAVTITTIYVLQTINANSTENQLNQRTKCETYGCVKAAAQIVSYIDESIDPCENFYQFANGLNIKELTEVTENEESHSFYDSVSEMMNRKIGPLLKEPFSYSEWKPFRLAKSFYQNCLNQSIILGDTIEQLTDIVNSLRGPVIEGKTWLSRKFDLIKLIRRVKELGFDTNILFKLDVHVDVKDKTKRFLYIDRGSYEIKEEESEYKEKIVSLYLELIKYKVDKSNSKKIAEELNRVLAFEEKLKYDLQTSVNNDEQDYDSDNNDNDDYNDDDVSYSTIAIKELQKLYPYLDWLEYINAILPFPVTKNEQIINANPSFFEKLGNILKSTSNRTLANYIVWRAIYQADRIQKFDNNDKKRRDICIDLTSEKYSIPVSLLYSRKYFNETSRQSVVNLVEDVRHAFIDMLGNVTWMDNDTRANAIEKAKNIVAHVGYTSELYENNELEEYYRDLEMVTDDFLRNSLDWNLFNNNQRFKMLRKPVNRSGWETVLDLTPNEANAFYDPSGNTIQFPIAILHELFFSMDRPRYINYASLGNTVGHEITHGFDGTGRLFDLNGNLANWWNSGTKRKFDEKSECFVQQYSQYKDATTKLTVDGAKTLNENIADNGGTRAAYYAYQNQIKRNEPEELVPGIKYNQKQLFWISYAQAEGGVFGQDYIRSQITNDGSVHAPNEFRVNGVVSNTPEFANDFNCNVGSKMNPMEKCRIW